MPPARPVRPATKAEREQALAQDAWRRGEALLTAGDPAAARPWLERACRYANEDGTPEIALGVALLALGDPSALELFANMSLRHDVREVWLGLAHARFRAADASGAAEALSLVLRRFRFDAAAAPLAAQIAAAVRSPGWCALAEGDRIVTSVEGARIMTSGGQRVRSAAIAADVDAVVVTAGGRHLIGSPIDAAAIRRADGFAEATEGGVSGWAWHPADAARDPEITIVPAAGRPLHLVARDQTGKISQALTQPRRFFVSAAALRDRTGPFRVLDQTGRDLPGSPVDPTAEARRAAAVAQGVARAFPATGRPGRRPAAPFVAVPASVIGSPANAPARSRRAVAVVVPVYRGAGMTDACLRAVASTVPRDTAVVVVDDASPERDMAELLDGLARAGRIILLRHDRNRGFVAAANTGLRAVMRLERERDVVLLNSDTVPADGWLQELRAVVHAAADRGTATPISNNATIVTYPDPRSIGPVPDAAEVTQLGTWARASNAGTAVEVPTAVGFCMYIRRECLEQTGLLREDAFAQGYGEENDFCLRARHLGWRHVAAPGAYVAHVGGVSFAAARTDLLARNAAMLERLHPGWHDLVAAWQAADPLAQSRRALDAERWRSAPAAPRGAVVMVTHDSGGGVERVVRERSEALADDGFRVVVLRPVLDRSGSAQALERRYVPDLCEVGEAGKGAYPNLRFGIPSELGALAALLAAAGPVWMEVHHLLGHHHAILGVAKRLGIPIEWHVHDYALFCPRINLIGTDRRYCGEPDVEQCVDCVADAGPELEEDIAPRALRLRSESDLAAAQRVVVPSGDAARRLGRHFPNVRPEVAEHEDDSGLPPLRFAPPGHRTVGVVGAVGAAKGYDILLACARDAAQRGLQLSFTVIGHTEDDARLLKTGKVFVTGPFKEHEAADLIERHGVHIGWIPSIWPETWCFALGYVLRAGIPSVVFDIGAQAERVRRTGRGLVLPLGLPAPAINNAMLALRSVASDVCARTDVSAPLDKSKLFAARS